MSQISFVMFVSLFGYVIDYDVNDIKLIQFTKMALI